MYGLEKCSFDVTMLNFVQSVKDCIPLVNIEAKFLKKLWYCVGERV